jgi:hypothetical protein
MQCIDPGTIVRLLKASERWITFWVRKALRRTLSDTPPRAATCLSWRLAFGVRGYQDAAGDTIEQ